MADKELRKMNRTELIEIIYALQQNERALREENERLQAQLDDKLLRIEQSGSIAEAALSLNHVIEDAEQAAQQYLASIREANGTAEQILADARKKADAILAEAEAKRPAQPEPEAEPKPQPAEQTDSPEPQPADTVEKSEPAPAEEKESEEKTGENPSATA